MLMSEKDKAFAVFLEMPSCESEKDCKNQLFDSDSKELDSHSGSDNQGSSTISSIMSYTPPRKTRADEFLNSENEKSDFNWLLTPPGTPLFPSAEMDSQKTISCKNGVQDSHPTALKPKLVNIQAEPASKSTVKSKYPISRPGQLNSSAATNRTASNGGRRAATPTGRSTIIKTNKPSRPTTPTSRANLSSTKAVAPQIRSSTPTRVARSSTPTARPSFSAPKLTSRSATPTRLLSSPSSKPVVSGPHLRPSSASKSRPTSYTNPGKSRGSSPSINPRPLKSSGMHEFSSDAPPNIKTSSERPASASRGRAQALNSPSASVEGGPDAKTRQHGPSPLRRLPSNGSAYSTGRFLSQHKPCASNNNDVSPVLIGSKMVERVVNMRKLAPPEKDDHCSNHNLAGKSSCADSSGFGRTLSKKSLDMAIRHMDITRRIPGKLRPVVTKVPASSTHCANSDSPLATSSNASSEPSVYNKLICLDGTEVEDNDLGSNKVDFFLTSRQGR